MPVGLPASAVGSTTENMNRVEAELEKTHSQLRETRSRLKKVERRLTKITAHNDGLHAQVAAKQQDMLKIRIQMSGLPRQPASGPETWLPTERVVDCPDSAAAAAPTEDRAADELHCITIDLAEFVARQLELDPRPQEDCIRSWTELQEFVEYHNMEDRFQAVLTTLQIDKKALWAIEQFARGGSGGAPRQVSMPPAQLKEIVCKSKGGQEKCHMIDIWSRHCAH